MTTSTIRRIKLESAQSEIRATVSRALATALIDGIDECKEEGRPLTAMQQIHLATMVVMSYEIAVDAVANLEVGEALEHAASPSLVVTEDDEQSQPAN